MSARVSALSTILHPILQPTTIQYIRRVHSAQQCIPSRATKQVTTRKNTSNPMHEFIEFQRMVEIVGQWMILDVALHWTVDCIAAHGKHGSGRQWGTTAWQGNCDLSPVRYQFFSPHCQYFKSYILNIFLNSTLVTYTTWYVSCLYTSSSKNVCYFLNPT